MNIEESRLKTFRNWPPCASVAPAKLAKAGFYYTERGETVKCFSCETEISEWEFADQVMAKHRQYSPQCPFVLNSPTSGNVPYVPRADGQPAEDAPSREALRDESVRLRTFAHWPKAEVVSPRALARSGFYSLNVKDYTKCAFCDVTLISWEPGDDPNAEHLRCSPACPHLRGLLGRDGKAAAPSNLRLIEETNLQELGVQQHRLPKHPDFATYETRLRTYAHWPGHVPQKPEELAYAGFYYEGVGDRVRCFHCDGGLNHWDPEDEPWSQHAHWFPNCCFILLTKGPDFIKQSSPVNSVPNSSTTANRTSITDQELQAYLDSEQARSALSVGLQMDRVKRAIKNKLDETGVGFSSSDALIEAALNLQINDEEPDDATGADSNLSRTVSNLLADVIHSAVAVDRRQQQRKKEQPAVVARAAEDGGGAKLTLEEENRRLKEARLCKICMDAEVGIVLLPCGHLTSCVRCAPNLKDCPLCRSPIKATVRAFLS